MRFIPSSVTHPDAKGADAESAVFTQLKKAFRGSTDGIGFYEFPAVDSSGERFTREPDFLLLHEQYGLVVIEVKGYTIDQITKIAGKTWFLEGVFQDTVRPYSQARSQAFFAQSLLEEDPDLCDDQGNCVVTANAIVALPNITREEWCEAGFDSTVSARVLLEEDLTPKSLIGALDELPGLTTLDQTTFKRARSVLTAGREISDDTDEPEARPQSKSEYYDQVESGLKEFDTKQKNIGLVTPDGPQQIRGIAGSGKTVLLAMKAAKLHLKHPSWQIAFTFNTKSLYQSIEGIIERFVDHFGNTAPESDLSILHGWGGRQTSGLYSKIALESGVDPKDVDAAEQAFGSDLSQPELLGAIGRELVESGDIKQTYDAIFIDEGQDFEPGFYQMCYAALTPEKRLIWAYDEAQNLTNLTAPTPSSIFGREDGTLPEKLDLSGQYRGGVQKSMVMRKSYRTPRQVLMVAHGLGMALKNPELDIPRITRKEGWKDIGYEVEGDFREVGNPIELRRPDKFSPHPLQNWPEAGPFVTFERCLSRDQEINYVSDSIREDIESEGLDPDDIMVIVLGPPMEAKDIGGRVATRLNEAGVKTTEAYEGDRDVFSRPDHVTVTRILRAKGNEAGQVYVMNIEATERDTWDSNTVQNRNELFVALTRTRGWCCCTGAGHTNAVYGELEEAIEETSEPAPKLTFPAPPQGSAIGDSLPSESVSEPEFFS